MKKRKEAEEENAELAYCAQIRLSRNPSLLHWFGDPIPTIFDCPLQTRRKCEYDLQGRQLKL